MRKKKDLDKIHVCDHLSYIKNILNKKLTLTNFKNEKANY